MSAKNSKKKSGRQVEFSDYRFKEKRKNNPDAGLATYNFKETKQVKYSYNPHLDPQLVWAGKAEHTSFNVDTVSLHIHERISTKAILETVQRKNSWRQEHLFAEPNFPMDKRIEFYQHEIDWTNRLILGDSLLVMNSLLERELMASKVQTIYFDPPYGVAYNSNFQPSITKREVRDADDNSLTREPEQIKAYRDTWTLGVHSYLTYLRDRLLLCRDLLNETGSIFVQISDENVHHVRELIDEIFGAENFVGQIVFQKSSARGSEGVDAVYDMLLWYAKEKPLMKLRKLYKGRTQLQVDTAYNSIDLPDGTSRGLTSAELEGSVSLPSGSRRFRSSWLYSQTPSPSSTFEFEFKGRKYRPSPSSGWRTSKEGLVRLAEAGRLLPRGRHLSYKRYSDDFPYVQLHNIWTDVLYTTFGSEKLYVVQTSPKVVERCILMTTDPGDLILDPTCGGGTTAFCAEKWGRRWITCDTSRIALSLSRQKLMTADFSYYKLVNSDQGVSGGFEHETVPHKTLKSIVQNEPSSDVTLYDKPISEADKVRVSGPFTVEAIPIVTSLVSEGPPRPTSAAKADVESQLKTAQKVEASDYVTVLIEILRKDGITFPGGKKLVLDDLRPLPSSTMVHAEGNSRQNGAARRVAISFGPRYGPITVKQVNETLRFCYQTGFDVLIFAGFAFEPEARAVIERNPIPKLEVHFANMNPDMIVGDLLRNTKTSQLFTVFGEPDVQIKSRGTEYVVGLLGVDIYDPITGETHKSEGQDIPAWFLDEDYDGLTFRITQAFFPKEATKKDPWDKLENALHGIIDSEKMEAFRGLESLPFKRGTEGKIAVKVIDVRGNEVMVVKDMTEAKSS